MTTTTSLHEPVFRLNTVDSIVLLRRDFPDAGAWTNTGLGEKPCLLVAILALGQVPVSRQELCEILWEGAEPAKARNSLRQAIFRVRRILGATSIREGEAGVWLESPTLTVDVLALDGRSTGPATDGARASARFAAPAARVGPRFDAWRQEAQRRLWAFSGDRRPIQVPPTPSAPHPDSPTLDWLSDLRRRSASGTPMTIWCTGRGYHRMRSVTEHFAASAAAEGARVARLGRNTEPYAPFTLERDLADALWSLPGAAGVNPEHRQALASFVAGQTVPSTRLRLAVRDLLDAVASDGPLVIILEHPERYSRQALSELVALIGQSQGHPILQLLVDYEGLPPISPLCLVVSVGEPSDDGRSQSAAS